MSRETFNLKGRKFLVESPLTDGLELVRKYYPNATREGSTIHWSYSDSSGNLIAESWPKRNCDTWWVKIKAIDKLG